MPKVSVIIPVYGVEKYIERCARSLFEQTLEDMEFLFIDDCTPDKSVEVLRSVLKDYPAREEQVQIYRMPHNSGQAKVREYGWNHCIGEYIASCDSDDYVDTDLYEKMWEAAVEKDADVVRCDMYVVTNGSKICDKYPDSLFENRHELMSMILGLDRGFSSTCDKIFKRTLFTENNIRFPQCAMNEDRTLTSQLCFLAKKIVQVTGTGYYYILNSQSITGRKSLEACLERIRQCDVNRKLIEEFLLEQGALKEYEDALVSLKHFTRYHIAQYTYMWDVYKKWMTMYPGINHKVLTNPIIPIKEKVKCLMTMVGVYPIFKKIKGE